MKTFTLVSIAAAALAVLAGALIVQRRSEPEPARIAVARVQPGPADASSLPPAGAPAPLVPETEPDSISISSPPQPAAALAKSDRPRRAADPAPAPSENPAAFRSIEDAPLDPLARVALAMVGADPDAEEYWLAAINDPSLPPQERQDLIEDLNEDGLSDPRHPTAEDLPLILSRLRLIEDIGEEAMDEVNADAFLEAYKDLFHLARLASGGRFP